MNDQLMKYAVIGARKEIQNIFEMFPELKKEQHEEFLKRETLRLLGSSKVSKKKKNVELNFNEADRFTTAPSKKGQWVRTAEYRKKLSNTMKKRWRGKKR